MDWPDKCKITPAGLVLGLLWDGPRRPEEILAVAERLWPEEEDGPVCVTHAVAKTATAINFFARAAIIYKDEQGLLHLRKQLLHPYTREIALRAREFLRKHGRW